MATHHHPSHSEDPIRSEDTTDDADSTGTDLGSDTAESISLPATQPYHYVIQRTMHVGTDSAVYLAQVTTSAISSDGNTSSMLDGDTAPTAPAFHAFHALPGDSDLTQLVILKVGISPEGELAVRHEAGLLEQCQHPHIIPFLDAGALARVSFPKFRGDPGGFFLAVPHLLGGDLEQRMRRSSLLAPLECLRLGRDIASAAAYLHATSIVHRDIKPANILLDHEERAVLCDLGLACRLNPLGMRIEARLGTLAYMPPEQWRGDALGAGTDIYALGVVLFQLLTGRLPFPEHDADTLARAHLMLPPPTPHLVSGQRITPDLGAILLKALRKSLRERYQHAAEFARALEIAEQDLRLLTVPTSHIPGNQGALGPTIGYTCPQCSRTRQRQWAECSWCGWPETVARDSSLDRQRHSPATAHVETCSMCGTPYRQGATLCLHCGADLVRTIRLHADHLLDLRCWHCGQSNPGDKILCLACGSPLY